MTLRIIAFKGSEITTLEQWSKTVRRSHWKPGRTAHSLADFIMNRSGAVRLAARISSVLSRQVVLEQGTPEYAARFGRYEGPARLDLGISGRTGRDESLFVGVEAKADEPFGSDTVCERWQKARETLKSNPRSKAAARVRELLSRYVGDDGEPCESRFAQVGYQLLTAAAGAVAVEADVSVLYVAVFRTLGYAEESGRRNRLDYDNFMRLSGGESLIQEDSGFLAHGLTLDEKRLVCIYEHLGPEG
ncbi:MAG: hypothetical protein OXR67_01760 [Chloroflexota bacterium]|nr:hypothetical protein [Chloroflexota bacterium]